jgi:predicted branched-subunit amino acid permease
MKPATDLVAALAFTALGVYMLFSIQPVWWSIISPIIVFAGAATFAVRGIRDIRANRARPLPPPTESTD